VDLAPGDRAKVFELNARRVYPRLDAALRARNDRLVSIRHYRKVLRTASEGSDP
jgi:hypothetical protein